MSFDGVHETDMENGTQANANRPTENGQGRYRDSGAFEGFGDDDFRENAKSAKKFEEQPIAIAKSEDPDDEEDYEDDFSDVTGGARKPIQKQKSKSYVEDTQFSAGDTF